MLFKSKDKGVPFTFYLFYSWLLDRLLCWAQDNSNWEISRMADWSGGVDAGQILTAAVSPARPSTHQLYKPELSHSKPQSAPCSHVRCWASTIWGSFHQVSLCDSMPMLVSLQSSVFILCISGGGGGMKKAKKWKTLMSWGGWINKWWVPQDVPLVPFMEFLWSISLVIAHFRPGFNHIS